MHKEGSAFSDPSASLEVRYTSKPVSGWGGLIAVVRYMDRLGVRELLRQGLADGRTSPNQIPVVDTVLAFLIAVLTGARRFAHIERLGGDEVIRGILAVKRIPALMTVTRCLAGLVRSQVEHLSAVLWQFTARRLHDDAPAEGSQPGHEVRVVFVSSHGAMIKASRGRNDISAGHSVSHSILRRWAGLCTSWHKTLP